MMLARLWVWLLQTIVRVKESHEDQHVGLV